MLAALSALTERLSSLALGARSPADEPNSDFEDEENPCVIITIQFCGAGGFDKLYAKARDLILEEFSAEKDKIEFVPIRDATATGSFEITVDGKLLHSRLKDKKLGFLHNNAAQQVIILDYIRERLDELEARQQAKHNSK